MKLRDIIRLGIYAALDSHDARKAGHLAAQLRARHGMTHADIMRHVADSGRDPLQFEELLTEADGIDHITSIRHAK
jgi:hypothetical protein